MRTEPIGADGTIIKLGVILRARFMYQNAFKLRPPANMAERLVSIKGN
jgi:hypothetical protein